MKKFILLALLVLPSTVLAATPLELAKNTMESLLQTRGDKGNIAEWMDMDRFVDQIVIDFKDGLNPEKYSEFKFIFAQVLSKSLKENIGQLTSRRFGSLVYKIKSEKGTQAAVLIRGKAQSEWIEMELQMNQTSSGWRVSDLSVDSVLLSRNYRGQFNRIYREEGMEGLLTRLRHQQS